MNSAAIDHVANRAKIVASLKEELVGPSPHGNEIDCTGEIKFDDVKAGYQPWRQQGSGEEILTRDAPTIRYGLGILFPAGTQLESEATDPTFPTLSTTENSPEKTLSESDVIAGSDTQTKDTLANSGEDLEEAAGLEQEFDNLDLSAANIYKPSTMAVSFLAEFPQDSFLRIEVTGGRYSRKLVNIAGHERVWWLRSPVQITGEFNAEELCSKGDRKIRPNRFVTNNIEGLDINIEVFPRPNQDRSSLITVCLINRSSDDTLGSDERCLFQAYFKLTIQTPDGQPHILPYPRPDFSDIDPEEQSLSLLFRHSRTFAVGHGCAADWIVDHEVWKASQVSGECLPTYETPSITADIKRKDGSPIEVSMAQLAGLVAGNDGFDALSELVDRYEEWIAEKGDELNRLPHEYKEIAEIHLTRCAECAQRMREGLSYLVKNSNARRAFELANHAILLQQICGQQELREIKYNAESLLFEFSRDYEKPQPGMPPEGKGQWRAFQIAFILMAIESAAESKSAQHETVDLIWFPTGGGKTEAYLGLAAFTMFLRRLRNPSDDGTDILMRYTLRLLTSQQFQRTSGLICAMEFLRRQMPELLGQTEFSIGIWLGSEVTPNTRERAVQILKELYKGTKQSENSFVLTRCPWCGAQLGPIKQKGKVSKNMPLVVGYEQIRKTVGFKCSDHRLCPFGDHLPIYVIDEDIYERRPTLIIGTVDKFAVLAWQPDARAIFGISPSGKRTHSPPSLIIQDELHLISGPLGSMVGLYEAVIEELCTDRRNTGTVKPKIISSTATIRRYAEQIRALYARQKVVLFPPPGIEAEDSFFATYARSDNGTLLPGKLYVGVHAPSLGSVQTSQVRVFTSLLQSPTPFSNEQRDPWWTLVTFFNSLRELGNTLSLFQSDIPTRLRILQSRMGAQFSDMRQIRNWRILELTGRMRNEEVHQAIPTLQISCTDKGQPIDVCLSSSIIEVGIDIDRLSLMVIVGQPKTTSQYIQVTGRIGRLWKERPGLIVTIYSPSKPRDRSHFEKFRSYHEKLYAQVEPSSVTPFSSPALERALHAVMTVYVRQYGDEKVADSPYPYPDQMLTHFHDVLITRLLQIENDALENFKRLFNKRATEWRQWQRTRWVARWNDTDAPLLTRAGAYVNPEWVGITWPTPTSMRNVDAVCEMQITTLYLREMENNHD